MHNNKGTFEKPTDFPTHMKIPVGNHRFSPAAARSLKVCNESFIEGEAFSGWGENPESQEGGLDWLAEEVAKKTKALL
jgi:hypothetical protein